MKPPYRHWLFWSSISLIGCKGTVESLDFLSVRAENDPFIPNVAQVSWETNVPLAGRVSVLSPDGEVLRSTPWTLEMVDAHRIGIVGLESNSLTILRPEARDSNGRVTMGEALEITTSALPPNFPDVEVSGDESIDDGLILTHLLSDHKNMVVVFDRDGTAVWYTIPEEHGRILSVRPSEDGRSIWYAQHPTDYIDTMGIVTHMAFDGSFHRSFEVDRVHSGVVPLPEGGFGYLKKMDEEIDAGILLWDEIWERDADGEERRIFSLRDHFEVEYFCGHWEESDPDVPDGPTYIDWTHSNSLVLSEDGLFWYLMVRHFDGILKIDRATGELEWVLGGPYSSFTRTGPGAELSHPHFSTVPDDSVLVFDNGSHYDPPGSRLVRLDFDEESREVSMGREIAAPNQGFVDHLGDVIRTPSGNLMGSWSTLGLIEEYDEDAILQWSLSLELGFYTGRITWIERLTPP